MIESMPNDVSDSRNIQPRYIQSKNAGRRVAQVALQASPPRLRLRQQQFEEELGCGLFLFGGAFRRGAGRQKFGK